jgi:hypothetical protein
MINQVPIYKNHPDSLSLPLISEEQTRLLSRDEEYTVRVKENGFCVPFQFAFCIHVNDVAVVDPKLESIRMFLTLHGLKVEDLNTELSQH